MSQTDQQFFDTLARFARDRGGGGSTVQQSLEATKLHAFCADHLPASMMPLSIEVHG